ncbi:ABC transporter ATP-binding protein [Sanguibacter antarcticus]|uniref:ABC transporter ATP-binding protein n=1 Tax=Sanguibacter antarcticus TaxID=372484 RepID=UPI001FE4C351|nr:ABC transporter ATP-binding protein [Sanguibacter antarcticus]
MLQVRELGFAYSSRGSTVLSGVSIDFEAGAITALTGPSGCGKSTLLYIAGLMLRPTEGAVLFQGTDVSALRDSDRSQIRRNNMGFVFQDALLDPSRTVLDNVLEPAVFAGVPRRHLSGRAHDLLEAFGVSHRASHRPGQISGGQAQRVALCRALLLEPTVILGDEPTGNLDADSTEVVWETLDSAANQGATVIIATHNARLATRAHAHIALS